MNKLRIGIVFVVYGLVFALAFLTGADTFTALGAQVATRGDTFTHFVLGFGLPGVSVCVGTLLVVYGRRQLERAVVVAGTGEALGPRSLPGWFEVFPIPAAVVLLGAGAYLGVFAYGAGEVYSSPPLVHLGARLIERWQDCERVQSTAYDIATMIERGVWEEAAVRRCADCLDDHPRCDDRASCDTACAPPEEPVPTIGDFGGQVEAAFFGTWELVNGDGTHARMIYDANGFQKILDGSADVVRGQWRARVASQTNTWEFLHVPMGGDFVPWVEALETVGNNQFRWLDGGMLFERQPDPATLVDTGPSQERLDECRRSCSRWRSCMRDMSDTLYCQDEMSRACRECRDQGLGR